MIRSRSGPRALMVAAGLMAIMAAPGGAAAQSPTPGPCAAGPTGDCPVIRWFIGVGSGGKPEQVAAEQKFAADLNASQKDFYLAPEIYDNSVAASQLQIEIAAGNPPDIIGPVGVEGLNIFRDNLLDLAPLIKSRELRHDQVRPGVGRLLQDGPGRQHDRRAICHVPVVHLLQQEPVR